MRSGIVLALVLLAPLALADDNANVTVPTNAQPEESTNAHPSQAWLFTYMAFFCILAFVVVMGGVFWSENMRRRR